MAFEMLVMQMFGMLLIAGKLFATFLNGGTILKYINNLYGK